MKNIGIIQSWLLAILLLLIVLFVPVARAAAPCPDITAQLSRGDDDFRQRALPAMAREALRQYEQVATETRYKDPGALWRVSMGCYFVGLRLTDRSSERAKIFAEGREAGLAAIALKPDCAQCQFWTAINMALYGQTVGVFKMLFSLSEIREHLKASLKLDPSYANGGAYRLLGVIEQKLPGILGGSDPEARSDFEKAIAVAPTEPLNYQFLASLLHDDLNDDRDALIAAKKGLAISNIARDRLESLEAQKQLRGDLALWTRH